MPKYRITGPDGQTYDVNAPDGASEQDVLAYAQRSFKMAGTPKASPTTPAKPFGQQLNDAIADVPRQLGLTARYGLEGVGDTLDFIASPIRAGLNAVLPSRKPTITDLVSTQDARARPAIEGRSGEALANLLGLPKPQTAQERIVGDAARLVAGGALPLGAGAALAKNGTGVAQGVGRMLAANPAQQLASAGAAGAAGGYTRETGGNDGAQLLASLAAGVAAPAAMAGGQRLASAAARRLTPAATTPQQAANIEITINNALQDSGLKLGDLPAQVAQGIRNDVAAAFRTTDQVSPDAIRRLADYRLTGATPTAAGLTLDPGTVTQQRNLAKLGINSKDQVAQQLGRTQNANNRALTAGLNDLGASTADDQVAGAARIMDALEARNARAQSIIGGLYDDARDSAGRSAALDHVSFTNRAADLLNEANAESFLTPDIRNKLNQFAEQKIPLNVDIAEQFKTNIGRLQRNSTDGNTRYALGLVRQALDETPLMAQSAPAAAAGGNQLAVPGGLAGAAPAQDLGQEAIDAFKKARGMNRSWMNIVERTPALQAVRDGIEPDKFVQQFIVGAGPKANVMDVAMLKNSIKSSPDAMDAVRTQITSYLKQRALNGAADEVGNFSNTAYNKALAGIGDRKLQLFFKPDEIARLKAIGRVASYEQFQPAGSAVNNSNTAGAAGAMLLDRIANSPLLSKLPFGQQAIAQPLQNISVGIQAGRALDVPAAIALPGRSATADMLQRAGLGLSPAAFMGQESEEERQRRLLAAGR